MSLFRLSREANGGERLPRRRLRSRTPPKPPEERRKLLTFMPRVPRVYCDFEDDQAYYVATEYVDGVNMSSLSEEQRAVVHNELSMHLAKLKTQRSSRIGGPSGLVVPPYRVMRQTETDDWRLQVSDHDEYVFCHNDLSQHNVIVDPDTLKIKAIVDWEYAGFYPAYFEIPFYTRLGPSVAIDGEVDDSEKLLDFLRSRGEGAA